MTKSEINSNSEIPQVKGLVLVGGKSTRMGKDKSQLSYFGKPQKEIAKQLLENNGLETFYSVRDFSTAFEMTEENQDVIANEMKQSLSNREITSSKTPPKDTKEITDIFKDLGPIGGICSAFQKHPNSAWLVLATDLPFVNDELIRLLLKKRKSTKVATSIKGKNSSFVEPLITIYEPKAYLILLKSIEQGIQSPRKVLMNSDIETVEVDNDLIRNINTPKEFQVAKSEINGQ